MNPSQMLPLWSIPVATFVSFPAPMQSDWLYLKEQPAGPCMPVSDGPEFDAVKADFAKRRPKFLAKTTIKPRIAFRANDGSQTVILFWIDAVDDLDAAYVVGHDGRILSRKLYSYWDWPIRC